MYHLTAVFNMIREYVKENEQPMKKYVMTDK